MGDLLFLLQKIYRLHASRFDYVSRNTHLKDLRNGTIYTSLKDLQNRTPEEPRLANGGRKSERGLRRFEHRTIATVDCLVDIPGVLRTNPNTVVQGF